jgi:hypothetical protein
MKKSKSTQPSSEKFETLNYTLWRDHESYMQTKGLFSAIPLWWKFFEGDQWGQITENTKNIPRPVYNLIEMIVDNKRSNITGSPVAFSFSTSLDEKSTDKLVKFDKYIMKKVDQQELDRQATLDSLIAGTGIYYYFWNEHAIGPKGTQEGSLDAEIIDVLDFAVSNPKLKATNFQKQKWVMVRKREEVKSVRAMVKDESLHRYITPDHLDAGEYDLNEEVINSGLVTVYIRFFRIDGEIYFTKETKSVVLCEPTPLNPYVTEKVMRRKNEYQSELTYQGDAHEKYDIDGQIPSIQDSYTEEESEEEYQNSLGKFSLYPFVVDVLTPRKNSMYGRSEPEALIPNQKVINLMLAMIAYDTQQQAWSKVIAKDGALRGQTINNEPGQLIIDYTPGNQMGIQRMQGNPISGGVMTFISSLIETTRTMRNASEIFTGDLVSRDLSGTAIAQIQAQAQKPIDDMQKRQWRAQKDCAAIRLQFYKLYYDNQEFTYERTSAELEEQKMAYSQFTEMPGVNPQEYPAPTKEVNMMFNGKAYMNAAFDIAIEAGQGTRFSEIMAADTLNTLFLNGGIQNMSPDVLEQYMTLMPDAFMPFKADLRVIIKKQQMSENAQLKQQLQQMQTLVQQSLDYAKGLEMKLGMTNEYANNLQKEFGNKIKMANEVIKKYQSKPSEKQESIASKADKSGAA